MPPQFKNNTFFHVKCDVSTAPTYRHLKSVAPPKDDKTESQRSLALENVTTRISFGYFVSQEPV